RSLERVAKRLLYLLRSPVPQLLLYLYLRERLPDPNQPIRGRVVRRALAGIFITLNIPWLLVGARVLFGGSVWSVGRIPFTGPWIAWQLLGWIYCALVAMYVLGKAIWWLARRLAGSGERGAARSTASRHADPPSAEPLSAPPSPNRRRR